MNKVKMNFWDFNKEPVFEGELIGVISKFGAFYKPVYVFKGNDNVYYHIWGTAMISKGLYNIKLKTKLKVIYLKTEKTEKSKYPVKFFDIVEI